MAILFAYQVKATVSLGISHYDPHALVGIGDIKEIPICKVSNEGNETLIISGVWRQTSGNLSLPVSMKYENITLTGGQSAELAIIAAGPSEAYEGTYTGSVEIEAHYLHPPSGNPVVPGGTVNVWLTVKHLKPAQFTLYGLTLNNSTVKVGEEITGSVTLKNDGEMTGTFNMVFCLDGVQLDSSTVTLGAGQQRTVDFAYKMNTVAGSHILSCGNLTQGFNVMAEASNAFEIPEWLLVVLCVGLVSGGGGAGGWFVYRKWLNKK
jgi:hypothetical protein